MEKYLIENERCTGCGACIEGCPQKAIEITSQNGFWYPAINVEKCIHCQKCKNICRYANDIIENDFSKRYYTVINKDDNERATSSSGGAFILVAVEYIKNGGIVYGAGFDEEWNVNHIRCDKKADLEKVKKSKYVQSNSMKVYQQVEKDLIEHRNVLFSGTPCQCNGLRAYLNERKCNTDRLLLIDLICHGVPSPQLWHEYVTKKEKKKKANLVQIDFRCKNEGWRDFKIRFDYDDGTREVLRQNEDAFLVMFFHNLILRESCYNCKYANENRIADITIGDFWGIWEYRPKLYDDKGASVVMINTEKGLEAFMPVSNGAIVCPISREELTTHQYNLKSPSKKDKRYKSFWTDYYSEGIDYVMRKYAGDSFFGRIKRKYLYKALYKSGMWETIMKLRNRCKSVTNIL